MALEPHTSHPAQDEDESGRPPRGPWLPLLVLAGVLLLISAAVYGAWLSNNSRRMLTPGSTGGITGNKGAPVEVEVKGRPAIKLDRQQIDRGNTKLGVPVSAAFQIANVGDQPLTFTEKPSVEVVEGC